MDLGSEAWLHDPDPALINGDDCVDMECTGLHNTVVDDLDGSLWMGAGAGQLVSSYGPAFASDTRCNQLTSLNAYACRDTAYSQLHFESLDNDRYTRRVHPVRVVGNLTSGAPSLAMLNSQQDHRWDDGYTSLLRLSRFMATVELGAEYYISFGYRSGTVGTAPRDMRLQIPTAAATAGIILNIQYTSPDVHKVGATGSPALQCHSQDNTSHLYNGMF